MDYGGDCPDADHREDGYSYDDCCDQTPSVTDACALTGVNEITNFRQELKSSQTGGIIDAVVDTAADAMDATVDAVDATVDATVDAMDAAMDAMGAFVDPLDDLETFGPDWVLDVSTCAAHCTFGFRSSQSLLFVEVRLEINVQNSKSGSLKVCERPTQQARTHARTHAHTHTHIVTATVSPCQHF